MNTLDLKVPAKRSVKRFSCLVLGNLALALAYIVTARLGLRFALVQGSVSLVWPPSGLALAAVTLGGPRLLPGVIVGAFLANFTSGDSWLFPLAATVGNSAEALVGSLLLRKLRFRPALDRVRDVLSLSLLAAPAGATIAATIGTAALWGGDATAAATAGRVWLHWLLGDIMGMIVISPVIFTVVAQSVVRPFRWGQMLEGIFLLMVITVLGLLIFRVAFPAWPNLSILLVPLLILVAFRFTPREVALANLLIAATVVIGAHQALGPTSSEILLRKLLTLSMLLLTTNLTAQSLAAVLAESRLTWEALQRAHDLVSRIMETSPVGITVTDRQGQIIFANARVEQALGLGRETIIGRTYNDPAWSITDYDGTPLADAALPFRRVMMTGQPAYGLRLATQDPNGHRRLLSINAAPLLGRDSQVEATVTTLEDVTERKDQEESLRLVNRALRILSQCSAAVVQAREEQALLEEVCRIAVGPAGYRLAWVGFGEWDEARTVRPVAYAGPCAGFLERIHVSWADNEFGQGVTGTAIRTGQSTVARDLIHNPNFAIWRTEMRPLGFVSAIAIPLKAGEVAYGALTIYATEPNAFDAAEVDLLEELGLIIAHGVKGLRVGHERAEALTALEQARAELEERVAERTAQLQQKIQERIQTEESLRRSEQKYRELVENANSMILRMDTEGRITFFNEFAQKFLGFTESEILGRSVLGTIVPQTESSGRDLVKLIHDLSEHPELHMHNENENMRRDGQRVWIAWTNKPVYDAAGRLTGILCIGNDITELKQAEQSLRAANSALAEANDKLAAADRIKSAFLATMSHELRTPLNSIIGFTGILLQGLAGPLNGEQNKQLGMVQTSARHLLALINDVLDISKIEAGQLEVRREPFDLRRSIEKVLEAVRPLAEGKGLALRHQITWEADLVVSDQRRVEQVLTNLLGNAIKFTEQGEVCVTCAEQNGWAVISVSDTGMGIKPEHLDAIFLPFLQIDCGVTRKHEGTGLGLSICKRLVELLGGTICVESRFGVGSAFTFTLPLTPGGVS